MFIPRFGFTSTNVIAKLGEVKAFPMQVIFGNTNPTLWTALIGITTPVLCYAGYRIVKWINALALESDEQEVAYEYRYIKELDQMLQSQLDDIEQPQFAGQDTIKVGKNIFSLETWRSLTRNYRKRLVRKAVAVPIVKKVPVPAEQFDWQNSYVTDQLPNGKSIVMRYEPSTESFWWYCDTNTVQYKYLETVARKYVCDFNRLDVFIDIREELRRGQKEANATENTKAPRGEKGDKEESGEGTGTTNQRQVYAKFKSYNKKTYRADPSSNKKRVVIKAKANRYSYKGSIARELAETKLQYERAILGESKATSGDTNSVSYTDWIKTKGHSWE